MAHGSCGAKAPPPPRAPRSSRHPTKFWVPFFWGHPCVCPRHPNSPAPKLACSGPLGLARTIRPMWGIWEETKLDVWGGDKDKPYLYSTLYTFARERDGEAYKYIHIYIYICICICRYETSTPKLTRTNRLSTVAPYSDTRLCIVLALSRV